MPTSSKTSQAHLPKDRYFNRELSWLQFNARVLEESENPNTPLLERMKFLGIFSNNLDEFFSVRVAEVMDDARDGKAGALEELKAINEQAIHLMDRHQDIWSQMRTYLKEEGIEVVQASECSGSDKKWLSNYFTEHLFPVLTPIAVDPSHPFPFLPNLGLAMLLQLKRKKPPTKRQKKAGGTEETRTVVIPIPQRLPRFIQVPSGASDATCRFVPIEEVLTLFQSQLFNDHEVLGDGAFRITRSSELEIGDEEDDIYQNFEKALKRRRRAEVVRVGVTKELPKNLIDFVKEQLNPEYEDLIVHVSQKALLAMRDLMDLYNMVGRDDLKYSEVKIRFPERINDYGGDCFAAIKAKDIIVHHPYESFDVVAQFVRQAAKDPDVLAIKQTLYRTSNDSPIVKALIEAAEAGKAVTVVVELKARFDEAANLRWGRDLERAGAQVIYGLPNLKTHCKVALIMREEAGKVMSYVHFGTGNYHPGTAKVYSDLSYFTTQPALCRDAALLFNYLTGYSPPDKFEKIALAPLSLRKTLNRWIDREIKNARDGKPAALWFKMNSLIDHKMIDKLYEASQAGVKVTLIVRGMCCLKAGVKGLSENITVRSVIGRFLEHARIYAFSNGEPLPSANAKLFISSADLMPRNLDHRVEVLIPLENRTVHEQVLHQILEANIRDTKQSWLMQKDGHYARTPYDGESLSAHEYFIQNPSLSGRGKALHHRKDK